MKKKKTTAVCKQCGKILVGESKTGLCEGCLNKDAGAVVVGAAAIPMLIKVGKKVGPKLLKGARLVWSIVRKG